MGVPPLGIGYSTMEPARVARPILPVVSVNHRLPSGPEVMPWGSTKGVGMGYSVMAPWGVIRPMLLPKVSVNHRLPSGPVVIPLGELPTVGMAYSVIRWAACAVGAAAITHPVASDTSRSTGVLRMTPSTLVDDSRRE